MYVQYVKPPNHCSSECCVGQPKPSSLNKIDNQERGYPVFVFKPKSTNDHSVDLDKSLPTQNLKLHLFVTWPHLVKEKIFDERLLLM